MWIGKASDFLRMSAGKQRPVEHGQFQVPRWTRNGDGEEAGILVVYTVECNPVKWLEGRQPQALPVEHIRPI